MSDPNKTRELLVAHRDALKARKAEIEEVLAPLRKERDELRDKLAPLEGKLREMNEAIKQIISESGLFEIDNEYAAIERALGAKSLKAEPVGAGLISGSDVVVVTSSEVGTITAEGSPSEASAKEGEPSP